MIKNFFVIAIRNLTKNKGYSILNIIGLSAGLTCFAFIAVWVSDEWSYDKFNDKADRIARVVGKVTTEAETFSQAVTNVPMAAAFKNDYAEVENTVRFDVNNAIVKYDNKQFSEEGILLTDPSFFDVFSYKLLQGDAKTALNEPYSIILTEAMAKKYFGNEDPLGKSLSIFAYDTTGKGAPYKVTGVMADAPQNAHFTFNFLGSFKTLEALYPELATEDGWGNNGYYTYLLLKDKNDIPKLQSKMPQFTEKHLGKQQREWKMTYDFTLQPLKEIHLSSHLRYEIAPTGSMQNVYIFSCVGLFILLIAAINYMNLATARSVQRAKEVGIKKVLGAGKKQLVFQYLLEAVIVTFFSLGLSLLLTRLLDSTLQQLSGKSLSVFQSPGLLIFLIIVSLLLGVLSGLYPAFFITAYKPANVLKGSFRSSAGAVWLRKSLVVVQFTISVVLIIGILVVNSQLKYIQHKDLGYSKDALVVLKVNGSNEVQKGFESFKNTIAASPLVSGVATSNGLLVGGIGNGGATTITGDGKPIMSSIYRLRVDADYMKVHEMKLLAGRNFSTNIMADSSSYLVNESAIKSFGWKSAEDAINKPFRTGGQDGKVIGVIKDFNFNSLQHPVEPLAILSRTSLNNFSQITARIDMSKAKEAIALLEKTWTAQFPSSFFEYEFVDDKLTAQYNTEERFAKFFVYFSLLSLLIACLGLLGLTAYATQQRIKEIGIRKVLGATVGSIVTMLSKDFLKLVLVASIIAFPLAWWAMNKWLQDFAYRTDINWWVFAVAGSAALIIALLTVSFQAIKAAITNPVKSLRTE